MPRKSLDTFTNECLSIHITSTGGYISHDLRSLPIQKSLHLRSEMVLRDNLSTNRMQIAVAIGTSLLWCLPDV